MNKAMDIERSIIKKFRKPIWSRFIRGITAYDMIAPGDKIAVCISGGKDSMLLAKLMQEIHRHGKMSFEPVFLCMDPGYNDLNRRMIERNAKLMNIPVQFFESEIYDAVATMDANPCYMCARMRRGHLYKFAQSLGCNKIALGHHFDDVIETTLLAVLYNGQFKTMMPKLRSTNFKGMELIRPMYMIKEPDIIDWMKFNALTFIQCACRLTENCVIGQGGGSKRAEMKLLVSKMRKANPILDNNIFRSIHNVNLNTVIGYACDGVEYAFPDFYNAPERLQSR
ncbi:MAG: ATP-binding protein [Eubacteriales bacterium]|nr:ATP-binding protein [Eubacteriales bacterium]